MIYLNVTNTIVTGAKTGIQRVVRELGSRLPQLGQCRLVVFRDSEPYELANSSEVDLFHSGQNFRSGRLMALRDIGRGDVFFDIDASWHDTYGPGAVWRQLKQQGSLLVRLHYDAIPLVAPQYFSPTTVFRYVENFSSALALFDYWICISRTTEIELARVAKALDGGRPVSRVFELGSDIVASVGVDAGGDRQHENRHKPFSGARYLLTVGTVEPRKNHALVLDAYEALIQDDDFSDVHLVIVGKPGWSNEAVIERIRRHQEFGRRIHWPDDVDDSELHELYRHAQICLCLSHYEGFGLPVVEALASGVPVICTAGSVMEEVAKERAIGVELKRDDVVARIKEILLAGKPESTESYVPTSWNESARQLQALLSEIEDAQGLKSDVRQAVYISIRPQSLLRSVQSVQTHMAFIEEVVVLTSDACFDAMHRELASARLAVKLIRESELGIDALPKDHQERNTMLRRHLYQYEYIDDNFIAFDDDYHVIRPVDRTVFIEDGVHKAYFFYQDGRNWLGAGPAPTSFDIGIWKSVAYLSRAAYDTKLYNSHQPQIMNRRLAVEILNRTAGLGLDEWSTYFNIAKHLKPDSFVDILYMTAGWPEYFNGWLPHAVPQELVFYNSAPVKGDSVRQAERWRDELTQVLEKSLQLKDVKLIVHEDSAAFSHDVIECPVGVKIFIPILSSSHVEYLSYTFLDHSMEFEGHNTPNFIATFKITQKRDFSIDVVAKTRDSERMTASLRVLVGRS